MVLGFEACLCIEVIVFEIKVSRGINHSPTLGDDADNGKLHKGEILCGQSTVTPNDPARHWYRYTSVAIEAAKSLNMAQKF